MTTIKIVAFAIGFVALFGAMFWLGNLAPDSTDGAKAEDKPAKERK